MGDAALQSQQNQNAALSQSADLLKISRLSEIFEAELHKSGADNAKKAVMQNLPEGIKPENVFIIQRENITAIIIHDPVKNTATVTIDPTHSGGNILTNPDYRDNLFRGPHETTLGGKVHGGLLDKLVNNEGGASVINRIEGVLHDLSSRQDTPLTVNFAGFSKGGSQAMMTAGEIMASGLFDDREKFKLGTLQAFSPVGFASQEFIDNFNKKVSELGGTATTIELQGDKNPTILTPDASGMFTRYDYGHVGNHAYIIPSTAPNDNGQIIINPTPEELKRLREQASSDPEKHNSNILLNILQQIIQKPDIAPLTTIAPTARLAAPMA